jgi:hypothetical protein
MIRWLMTRLRGPLCDYGTAVGRGCLEAATWESTWMPAEANGRRLRWCNRHASEWTLVVPCRARRGEEGR